MRKTHCIQLVRGGKTDPNRIRFPSTDWPKVSEVVAWYKLLKYGERQETAVKVSEPPGETRALPPYVTGGSKLGNSFLISNRRFPLYFCGSAGSERGASVSKSVSAYSPGLRAQTVRAVVDAYSYIGATNTTWLDERTGVTMPGFQAKIRDGANATTPMEAHRATIRLSPGEATCTWDTKEASAEKGSFTDSFSGCLQVGTVPKNLVDSALLSVCDSKALAKLHEKLAEFQRSADMGETLAEFGQVLSMLKRPAAGIQDLYASWYRKAIRLDCSSALDFAAALGKLELEYSFGWKPLLLDTIAAVEAVTKVRNAISAALKVSYKESKNVVKPSSGFATRMNYFRFRVLSKDDLVCTVRYQVGLRPDQIATPTYMEEIGLSVDRIIPTMYALMPYSWTVDYFTGLNATIDALCADLSMIAWTCKTTRWERTSFTSETLDPVAMKKAAPGLVFTDIAGVPFSREVKRFDVKREVPTTLIPIPTLRVPKSMKPYVNLAALFASRLRLDRKSFNRRRYRLEPLGGSVPRYLFP